MGDYRRGRACNFQSWIHSFSPGSPTDNDWNVFQKTGVTEEGLPEKYLSPWALF